MNEALAHTDYDWQTDRGEPRPPKHAAASALFGDSYLASLTDDERAAVLLAVVGHHGGTLKGGNGADKPHKFAVEAVAKVGLN